MEATIPSCTGLHLDLEAKAEKLVVEKAEEEGMERIIFVNPIMIKVDLDNNQKSRIIPFFDFDLCNNRFILFCRFVVERVIDSILDYGHLIVSDDEHEKKEFHCSKRSCC